MTMPARPASSQDNDARLRHDVGDYQRTVFEGAMLGGLGTCAVGALTGFLSGGSRGALRGCIAGGIVGTVVGTASGVNVANQKQAFAEHEDSLDQEVLVLRKQNQELNSIVVTANRIVEQRRVDLARLNAAGAGDTAERRKFQAKLTSEIELIDAAATKARDDRQKMQEVLEQWRHSDAAAAASANSANAKDAETLEAARRKLDAMRGVL